MKALYFRTLFRNMNDGIYHILSMWNEPQDYTASVVYLCGADASIPRTLGEDASFADETFPIDLLVISHLNLQYLEYVIEMLELRRVKQIIMPYMDKKQRASLLRHLEGQEQPDKLTLDSKGRTFLRDPYRYALSKGVEEFRYLMGNGPAYEGQDTIPGGYFQPLEKSADEKIWKEEDGFVPVYKAGYLIMNRWVLSFGVYQGNGYPTIVMYHGSIEDDLVEEDCVMSVKPFSYIQSCKGRMKGECDLCSLACTHRSDFDLLKGHSKKALTEYENGTLLLGNMLLPGNVERLYHRFHYVKEKVRFLSVPNCGAKENWDYRVMGFGKENNYRYYACPVNTLSDADTFRTLGTIRPYIRLSMLNEYYGLCGSGFLTNRIN